MDHLLKLQHEKEQWKKGINIQHAVGRFVRTLIVANRRASRCASAINGSSVSHAFVWLKQLKLIRRLFPASPPKGNTKMHEVLRMTINFIETFNCTKVTYLQWLSARRRDLLYIYTVQIDSYVAGPDFIHFFGFGFRLPLLQENSIRFPEDVTNTMAFAFSTELHQVGY